MISRRVVFVLVVWMSLSSLNGCAGFRSGETQPPASWPMSKGPGKQSISLLVTGEELVNGMRHDVSQRTIQHWQDAATNAYKESGLFSDVQTDPAETDLRAEINVLRREDFSEAGARVSGSTLTLVPARAECEFAVKTTLKNKEGQDLGTFEKKETFSMWIQFFLIFIMPFNWPWTIDTGILYDLHRATISQAYGTGLL
jgi:hypothetical protein